MNKVKTVGLVLLVLGGILLYFGYNAATAPMEEIGEALTGRYSNETMMYLIAGGISAVLGLLMLIRGR
ncbi:MAG TPA: DUF3185 family protein [Desulfuromonadales bacterium]|nr:DUF3185 family protein [Desulfuromonadales bacterium]